MTVNQIRQMMTMITISEVSMEFVFVLFLLLGAGLLLAMVIGRGIAMLGSKPFNPKDEHEFTEQRKERKK